MCTYARSRVSIMCNKSQTLQTLKKSLRNLRCTNLWLSRSRYLNHIPLRFIGGIINVVQLLRLIYVLVLCRKIDKLLRLYKLLHEIFIFGWVYFKLVVMLFWSESKMGNFENRFWKTITRVHMNFPTRSFCDVNLFIQVGRFCCYFNWLDLTCNQQNLNRNLIKYFKA